MIALMISLLVGAGFLVRAYRATAGERVSDMWVASVVAMVANVLALVFTIQTFGEWGAWISWALLVSTLLLIAGTILMLAMAVFCTEPITFR